MLVFYVPDYPLKRFQGRKLAIGERQDYFIRISNGLRQRGRHSYGRGRMSGIQSDSHGRQSEPYSRCGNPAKLSICEPELEEHVVRFRGRNLFFMTDVECNIRESKIIFIRVNTP